MLRALLSGIVLLTLCISCKEEDIQLTKEDLYEIDTLYRNARLQLQPEIDSLCKAQERKYYDSAFDSIFSERMERINRLKQLR